MKWWQIVLTKSVLGNFRAVIFAAGLGGAIADVMLGTSQDAVGSVQALALIAAHVGTGQRRAKKRILASAFGDATPARVTSDIHHGRKGPAHAGGRRFLGGNARNSLHNIRIPGRGKPEVERKRGAKTVYYVEAKKQWNMKARFVHGNMLQFIGGVGAVNIEERTDLSLADHVAIVSAAGSGSGGWSGGILDELADFFFQRHLSQ